MRSQPAACDSRNLDHDRSCALKCKTGIPVRAVDFYDLIKVGKIRIYTCVSDLYRGRGFQSEPILKFEVLINSPAAS